VLTGETGAGKSILIDALQLVTGARGRRRRDARGRGPHRCQRRVRHAQPCAARRAGRGRFRSRRHACCCAAPSTPQGKSRAWINGSPATAQQLRAVGEQLLDIHGQHAWQSLTRPGRRARPAGRLCQGRHQRPERAVARSWRRPQTALAQATPAQDSLQRERERLAWQIGEAGQAQPAARRMARTATPATAAWPMGRR